MLTITFDRDGRTWYGRRTFKVRLENEANSAWLEAGRMSAADSAAMIRTVIAHEVASGRPLKIVDNR